MGMIELILVIALVGVLVWFIQTYVPMHPAFKTAIVIIAVFFVVWLLLGALGMVSPVRLR